MDSDANDTRPIGAVLEDHCSILTEMADGDFILQMKSGKDVNTAFETCSLCEKKFVTEDYLKKHRKKGLTEKKNSCVMQASKPPLVLSKKFEAKSPNVNCSFIKNSFFLGTFWDGSGIASISIVK